MAFEIWKKFQRIFTKNKKTSIRRRFYILPGLKAKKFDG